MRRVAVAAKAGKLALHLPACLHARCAERLLWRESLSGQEAKAAAARELRGPLLSDEEIEAQYRMVYQRARQSARAAQGRNDTVRCWAQRGLCKLGGVGQGPLPPRGLECEGVGVAVQERGLARGLWMRAFESGAECSRAEVLWFEGGTWVQGGLAGILRVCALRTPGCLWLLARSCMCRTS